MATQERIAKLRNAIESGLAPATVTIHDDSARHAGHAGAREGGHFRVHVVSERFRGRGRIERHRLVYEAVGSLMGTEIHALNITALAPEELTS
jgi:BolA family transcriptional regulator, general stress-responsive regulator